MVAFDIGSLVHCQEASEWYLQKRSHKITQFSKYQTPFGRTTSNVATKVHCRRNSPKRCGANDGQHRYLVVMNFQFVQAMGIHQFSEKMQQVHAHRGSRLELTYGEKDRSCISASSEKTWTD